MFAVANLDFAELPKTSVGQQPLRSHLLVARARIKERSVGIDRLEYEQNYC